LPGATLNVQTASGGAGLDVVSVSYHSRASASSYYYLWLIEIVNRSAEPICYAEFSLSVKNASGTEIMTNGGFAKAARYTTSSAGLLASCIPPGGKGVALDNYLEPEAPPSTADMRRLDITLTGLDSGVAPSPLEPTVSATSVVRDTLGYAVRGTLHAVQSIDFPSVDVFPRSNAGYLLDWLNARYLDGGARYTLPGGEDWTFTTDTHEGTFSTFAMFTDFLAPSTAAASLERVSTPARLSSLELKAEQYRARVASQRERLRRSKN
jgi:hypothetical protein